MPNYDESNAHEILEQVIADGAVNADEVRALERKIQRDWMVDREEVDLLFRVNRALGERVEQCPEWTSFFVDSVSRLLIMELDTPGEIDEAEGNWLAETLDQHGVGNATESALLNALRKGASKISGRIVERLSRL